MDATEWSERRDVTLVSIEGGANQPSDVSDEIKTDLACLTRDALVAAVEYQQAHGRMLAALHRLSGLAPVSGDWDGLWGPWADVAGTLITEAQSLASTLEEDCTACFSAPGRVVEQLMPLVELGEIPLPGRNQHERPRSAAVRTLIDHWRDEQRERQEWLRQCFQPKDRGDDAS